MYRVTFVNKPYGCSSLKIWAIFDDATRYVSIAYTAYLIHRTIYDGVQDDTVRSNAFILASFLNTLERNNMDWKEISDSEMRKYFEGILFRHRNLSPQTIANHISIIKSFYTWAQKSGFCENADLFSFNMSNEILEELELHHANKRSNLPVNMHLQWITNSEFEVLLEHNPGKSTFETQRNEIILMMGYLCGCRAREVTNKENFKLKDIQSILKKTKSENPMNQGFEIGIIGKGSGGGKHRYIWIPDNLSRKIQLFINNQKLRNAENLICAKNGKTLNKQFASKLFSEFKAQLILNEEDIQQWASYHRGFHSLRHSYATNFVLNNGHGSAMRDLLRSRMGHEKFSTTEVYITFSAVICRRTFMQDTEGEYNLE